MSLDEYAALCAEYASDEIAQDATYGQVSAELAASIELMESVNPPLEVADWHNESLAYGKAVKGIADGQPGDETANPFVFLLLLPQLQDLEATMNALDPGVRRQLAATGCLSEEDAAGLEIGSPEDVRFAVEGSTIRVSWDEVSGAGHYNVYYANEQSCHVLPDGDTVYCELLASNVVETAYTHSDPHEDMNYYWVAACDGAGCSRIDEEESARSIEGPPHVPGNVRFSRDRATATVTWDSSEGATHYKVYYNQFEDPECFLAGSGTPLGCRELDGRVVGTTYVHEEPDPDLNYYWVVACDRRGCSEIDSLDPARPVAPRPAVPSNVTYGVEGPTVRVTWDPVEGADYYAVFHDRFFGSACSLEWDGTASFCDELATDLAGTTYVHTDPGPDQNYYWVIACNRGGCSAVDSGNPASPAP